MAAKLKDGLFLGDYEAAQDLEFIVANKITHIINCAGREIPNGWERSGIRYLTYFWPESGNCVIFDESNAVLDEIYSFIEQTIDNAESVLVHSIDGASRACFCCAVYFMLKYRWTLDKTILYLQSKRPDLQPRPGFMRQLYALDQSLRRVTLSGPQGQSEAAIRRYTAWDPTVLAPDSERTDEMLLTHTFINSQPQGPEAIAAAQQIAGGVHMATKLTWIDDPRNRHPPVNPVTRRPTPERPPSASYSARTAGPGWVDNLAPNSAQQLASANHTAREYVYPHKRSALKVKSILKGGKGWGADKRRVSIGGEVVAAGAGAGGGSGTGGVGKDSARSRGSTPRSSARGSVETDTARSDYRAGRDGDEAGASGAGSGAGDDGKRTEGDSPSGSPSQSASGTNGDSGGPRKDNRPG